jgi:hypothetical protein
MDYAIVWITVKTVETYRNVAYHNHVFLERTAEFIIDGFTVRPLHVVVTDGIKRSNR